MDPLEALGIRPADLQETFSRSGGKGGQNVNKVASAVTLVHVPTGVWVRCETERSQAANRIIARQRLAEKLEGLRRQERLREQNAREKLRRASRRPGPGAQRRRLDEKKRRGEVKRGRRSNFDD